MAYGIGAMARGLAVGQDQVYRDRDNRKMMGMREETHQAGMEAHDTNMAAAKQQSQIRTSDSEWAGEVRQNQRVQWQQQQQELEQREALKQAMLKAEVTGDPTPLVEVFNATTDGLIQSFEPTKNGFEFQSSSGDKFELGREELMGLGASLLQPGKLTELRQAALSANQERAHDLRMEQLKRGEWGTDADGNRAFREAGESYTASPEMNADKIPADVATNQYVARVMGITEAEALQFRQTMRGKSPADAIQEIARSIQDNSMAAMRLGNEPEKIYAEAARIYETLPQQSFGIQSKRGGSKGAGGQGSAGGAPADTDVDAIAAQAKAKIAEGVSPDAIRNRLKERGFSDQKINQIMSAAR